VGEGRSVDFSGNCPPGLSAVVIVHRLGEKPGGEQQEIAFAEDFLDFCEAAD
jgi:hypothetical protein